MPALRQRFGGERASWLDVAEAASFTLLNELRTGLGLHPLVRDGEMDAFARDWSATMDAVPALVAAGATDFRAMLRLADDAPDARERIAEMVAHFREAVGRD